MNVKTITAQPVGYPARATFVADADRMENHGETTTIWYRAYHASRNLVSATVLTESIRPA